MVRSRVLAGLRYDADLIYQTLKESTMLEESTVYQDIFQKGERRGVQLGVQQGVQQGMQQGESRLALRLLERRLGRLSLKARSRIESLALAQLDALCDTLLVELAPFGVRVLEVLPGPVATDGLAGSDYVDAVEYEPYREAAERMMASRGVVHDMAVTTAQAAIRIVDAILTDNGPMRSSCDPMGDQLLEQWRTTSDQERLDGALARYVTFSRR